jgi:hypothetical protein
MRQLDQIERAVVKIVVPAAFGDMFYGLRGHIASVRESVKYESALSTLPAEAISASGPPPPSGG